MKRLRVATSNAGKLREFSSILTPLGWNILGPPPGFTVAEDGTTFIANAIVKARALLTISGEATVADDSGLEVDALRGAPGVYSARYSGSTGPTQDADNRAKLLRAMQNVPTPERTAHFICSIAYCDRDAAPVLFSGTVSGTIAHAEAGQGGFGYDAIFIPHGESQTFAELPLSRKQKLSHRGQALRSLAAYLKSYS